MLLRLQRYETFRKLIPFPLEKLTNRHEKGREVCFSLYQFLLPKSNHDRRGITIPLVTIYVLNCYYYRFILCSSFSQPDDTAVFLLFLRAAKWLVGVEVPGETEPEDAATVAAGIGEGIDGIVGRDVPATGVEHVGDEG